MHAALVIQCPGSVWTESLDGMYCGGWAHQGAYALTFDECKLYCCGDPNCAGFSFLDGNEIFEDAFCVIGNDVSQCVPSRDAPSPWRQRKFRGASRKTPADIPQPVPSGPQSPAFDDASWKNLNLPHDYVVEQVPSAHAEKNHGYRPKNISWYRKTFDVVNAGDNQVFLEFDGVFRSSDMWLNGVYIGHHSSGYTSFQYRIDNVTGFKPSGQNVIAVRTDPRANEGWWYEVRRVLVGVLFSTFIPSHFSMTGWWHIQTHTARGVRLDGSSSTLGSVCTIDGIGNHQM